MNRRTKIYGKNVLAIPKFPSFLDMLASQFEDSLSFNLIIAATVYLLISLLNDQFMIGTIESLTIYSGVLLSALVCSISDWIKMAQYYRLAD